MDCYEFGCKGKHFLAFAPYIAIRKSWNAVSEKQENINIFYYIVTVSFEILPKGALSDLRSIMFI